MSTVEMKNKIRFFVENKGFKMIFFNV